MTELALQTVQEPPALSDEQQRTLDALLAHPTKKEAAQALGIARVTLYDRLKNPALRQAYDAARRAAIQDAFDSAASTTVAAMAVLFHIAHNADAPYAVRVQAASKLCDLGLRSVELEEVRREVAEIKEAVGLAGHTQRFSPHP